MEKDSIKKSLLMGRLTAPLAILIVAILNSLGVGISEAEITKVIEALLLLWGFTAPIWSKIKESKKILSFVLALAASTLIPFIANAAPFLVSDPNPGAAYHSVRVNGEIETWGAEEDGSIRHDLADFAPGSYELEISACNLWEDCSVPVPFGFIRATPGSQSGISLERK